MRKPRRQLSLLAKFSILSLLVTATIALTLAYLLQQKLIENAMEQEAASAVDQVDLIIAPTLGPSDLGQVSPEKIAELDEQLRDVIGGRSHIVRVKIWNSQGVLIYSDEKDLIGKQFPLSDELKQALTGKTAMELSTLTEAENATERGKFKRLLEIYVPIPPHGVTSALGAYEIYHDLDVLQPHLDELSRMIFLGLGGGFLVLYVSLFAIVRSASRELVRRNEENALLYAEERQKARQMQIINEVGRQVSSILEPEQLLDQVLRLIMERFHYDRVSISLIREHHFTAIKLRGFPPTVAENPDRLPHMQLGGDRGLIALAYEQGKSIAISDVSIDSRWVPFGPDDPTRSAVAIPMVARGQTIGVIGIGNDKTSAIEQSDVLVLESLAAQVAIAVENAQLYESVRRNFLRLRALRSIDHSISSTLELKRTLDLLLSHAIEQIGAGDSAGLVLLVRPEDNSLEPAAFKNLGEAFIKQFSARVSESISARVAEDGKTRAVVDLAADPRAKFPELLASEQLASLLAVPIRAGGKIIGVLSLYMRHPHKFSDEEVDFFVTLGGQAAIAVHNAQLYERAKGAAADSTTSAD